MISQVADTWQEEEGLETVSPAPPSPLSLPNLHFRLSPKLKMYRPRKKRARAEVDAEADARAANATAEAAASMAAAEAAEAAEAADRKAYSRQISVLLLMLDATSRAHLHRMLPRSLAVLRALSDAGSVTLYEFPHYSIVGYNSVPSMMSNLARPSTRLPLTFDGLPSSAQHAFHAPPTDLRRPSIRCPT